MARMNIDTLLREIYFDDDGTEGFTLSRGQDPSAATTTSGGAALPIKAVLAYQTGVLGASYNSVGLAGVTSNVTITGAAVGDLVLVGQVGTAIAVTSATFTGFVTSSNTVSICAQANAGTDCKDVKLLVVLIKLI